MLNSLKKYFLLNYEKIKLSMSLMLGVVAIILLVFYLIGCIFHLWAYSILDVIFNPVAGSIFIVVPLFALIIILRFLNYYKTRSLFYKIIKDYRGKIKFSLQKDTGPNSDDEIKYILWGNFKDSSFRFSYSLGHPLKISLIVDMKNYDAFRLNALLAKLKIRGRRFNGYGLTLDLNRPFSKNNLAGISEKLDLLLGDLRLILNTAVESV